ncbi:MAG: hypothetical protein IKU07_03155 [Oscillospiraceae bacterium]|nr:hypothetical protein [Oscillospiraceae bacterium]
MKKLFILLLAVTLCFALFGCGKEEAPKVTVPDIPVTNGAEKLTDPVAAAAIAGTYKPRLWFLEETLTVNEDYTYTLNTESGSFTLEDKYITLQAESGNRSFIVGKDCIYTFESWHFDADEESGVTFSPDRNGLTDQSFTGHMPEGNIPGCGYDHIFLDLDSDGTFTLQLGNKSTDGVTVAETFEGSYFCKSSTLLLTYNGENYPLIMNNANYIFFLTYDKIS